MAVRALITDGEQRAALASVRSLGQAGYRPYVCASRARSLAGASRYCQSEAAVPDPLREREAYVAAIESWVREWEIGVLLPVSEASLLAILAERSRFPGVCIPFPAIEQFRSISDKALVLQRAAQLGVATPAQVVVNGPQDAGAPLINRLRFPLVLKPSRSVAEADGERVKLCVEFAADEPTLRAKLERLPRQAYPLLLQQRVDGDGIGVFLLRWEGELLARFAHRRIREKPPAGGVSVYRESVAADPQLVASSTALLESFDWQSVAMIEYKVERETGTPYLMEINGRFWGSLQLAIDAGVDFPRLLLEAAMGHKPEPVMEYQTGIRSRWWWGDVDHLLTRLRRSASELALPPGAPTRWQTIRSFARLWSPGDRNEIFRLSDPMPLYRESIDWIARR